MMKYFVKGGKNSNGKHGYIVSNADWDPYPMANKLEDFIIALANMDIAVSLRIDRFSNSFFTLADPAQALHLPPGGGFQIWLAGGGGYTPVDLEQEIQSLTNPVAPSGAAIVATVEDLQAQTRIKAYRVRHAVSTTFDLLAHDLLTATFWLDVRKGQDPSRNFGAGPTAAWTAFRKVVPVLPALDGSSLQPRPMAAAEFLRSTPAAKFYTGEPRPPSSEKP
jgi:histidine ammonia-lyase